MDNLRNAVIRRYHPEMHGTKDRAKKFMAFIKETLALPQDICQARFEYLINQLSGEWERIEEEIEDSTRIVAEGYILSGNFKKALGVIDKLKCSKIGQIYSYSCSHCQLLYYISVHYFRNGDLNQSKEIAGKIADCQARFDILKHIAQTYLKAGDYKSALEAASLTYHYLQYNDRGTVRGDDSYVRSRDKLLDNIKNKAVEAGDKKFVSEIEDHYRDWDNYPD